MTTVSKVLKSSAALLVLIGLVSCGASRVSYDYDKQTDFTTYTTYNYFDGMKTGLSQLDEKRLKDAMDATLQMKGFMLTEEPDIYVDIQSSIQQVAASNNVGVGLGGGRGAIGGGLSVGIPLGNPKMQREVKIDFVDANKDMLIWQAIGSSAYLQKSTPQVKTERIQKLITKIFKKYPPKQ